jgi:hypothetical protein
MPGIRIADSENWHEMPVIRARPVTNLSDPTSETALVYLIAIIDDGHSTVREEVPQISRLRTVTLGTHSGWHCQCGSGSGVPPLLPPSTPYGTA